MKQLITILLCLFTLFVQAQNTNDTTKYFKSYDYGFSYKRLQAREAFIMPTDTVINKLGAVALNGVIYLGNGTKWTSIGGAGTTPDLQKVLIAGEYSYGKNMHVNTDTSIYNQWKGFNFFLEGTSPNSDGSEFIISTKGGTQYGISLQSGLYGTYNYGQIAFLNSDNGDRKLKFPYPTYGQFDINLPPQNYNGFGDDTLATMQNIRDAITTPIDTTSLSSRINLKIDSLKRSSDSVYAYKNGTRIFQYKDSVGGSSRNGRFGNDTATVVMVKVHNDAGVTLTNGKVVALTTSGNNNEAPAVRLANSKGDSTSANTLGFVSGTIANQDTGWVILSGKIEKLNTSAYNNGDIIYLDTINGNYTNVKPQAPTHLVYLGVVVKANAGNGAIFVKAQNGYELDEIHDVRITSKLNNQIIVYSDTQKVWKNKNIYSIVDTSSTVATKSNVATKLNITDTTSMLAPYSRTNVVNASLATKLNAADTASLSNRISNEVSNLDILQALGYKVKAEPYGLTLVNATAQLQLTAGRTYFYPFNWNVSDSIRGVSFFNRAASSTNQNNYNGCGIYSLSGGTLTRIVATTNDSTFWDCSSNTWSTKTIPTTYLAKGIYFFAYQISSVTGVGTLPTIIAGDVMPVGEVAGNSPQSPPSVINTNGVKFCTYVTNAATTLPSSVAMSTTVGTNAIPYFMFY